MVKASIKTNSKNLRQGCVNFVQSLLFGDILSVDNDTNEDFDILSFDAAFYKEVIAQAYKAKKQIPEPRFTQK